MIRGYYSCCRYIAYIPQQLVEDYEVKSATFPSGENNVFSETALAVFGPNCCPQLLRLGTIVTGVCASTKMIRKVLLILHYRYTKSILERPYAQYAHYHSNR